MKPIIAVIGDPIIDYWIELVSTRPNPEMPSTPVVVQRRRTMTAGGASNVMANLLALGYELRYVVTTDDTRLNTSVKTRYIVDDRLMFRHDDDRTVNPAAHRPLPVLLNELRGAQHGGVPLALPAGLIIADYNKGAIWAGLVRAIVADNTIPEIVIDAKPRLLQALTDDPLPARAPGFFVTVRCNKREADDAGFMTADQMRTATGADAAVITMGVAVEFATATQRHGLVMVEDCVARPVTVCGAGDVFTALYMQGRQRRGPVEYSITAATAELSKLLRSNLASRTLCLPRA